MKQGAFRALATYQVAPETEALPSVVLSIGVQGIGTGNPGYSATAEKNWQVGSSKLNLYGGLGYRANGTQLFPLGGLKLVDTRGLSIGVQHDGFTASPFATLTKSRVTYGVYIVGGRNLAYLIGTRF